MAACVLGITVEVDNVSFFLGRMGGKFKGAIRSVVGMCGYIS